METIVHEPRKSKRILNEIRDLTGNQCSCCKSGVLKRGDHGIFKGLNWKIIVLQGKIIN